MKKFLSILLCLLLATNAFSADFSAMKMKDTTNTIINPATSDKQGALTPSGASVVGTAYDRFRDDFFTFDEVNNWTVVQIGSGQSITNVNGTGSASYLRITSGNTNGAETIILSKQTFKLPFKIAVGVSLTDTGAATDGRVANLRPVIEVVEVDSNGNVVETASAETYLGQVQNAMAFIFDGTTATTHRIASRTSGISEYTTTGTSWGTTVPSGTYPNLIQAYNYTMTACIDSLFWNSEIANTTTASTARKLNTRSLDPSKTYAIRIRLKNTGAVATSTDFNIHMVRVMDASRVSVDFGMIAGNVTDNHLAIPVYATNMVSVVYTRPLTSYGSSSSHSAIMANSTNETLVKNSVGVINSFVLSNASNDDVWFKLYNKASAPVLASDTPVKRVMIPAGQTVAFSGGTFSNRLATGIAYAVTKGIADTDTTAVEANKILVNIDYD